MTVMEIMIHGSCLPGQPGTIVELIANGNFHASR
jgi:hypothetical protein